MEEMGEGLRRALATFASRPRILVAADFDGTLAPLVADPMQATALPGGLEALHAVATLDGVTTAIVSGRDLATLETLTGLGPADGITLIGSHGAETTLREGGGLVSAADATVLDDAAAALLSTLHDELEQITSRYPPARLEDKAAAAALHTRGVDARTAKAATEAALQLGRRLPGVHVMVGKEVVELSVSAADKGSAVADLARASRSEATLYVGDDLTDERAFTALNPDSGDLTVKVGSGSTAAVYRVAGPETVVELLALVVESRRGQG